MTKLHTPRNIADLIRLAEGPHLATIADEDVLLECAADLFDVLQLCDAGAGEGARRHTIEPERIEAAWEAFISQGANVMSAAEDTDKDEAAEDEILMGLLTVPASRNPTKH